MEAGKFAERDRAEQPLAATSFLKPSSIISQRSTFSSQQPAVVSSDWLGGINLS